MNALKFFSNSSVLRGFKSADDVNGVFFTNGCRKALIHDVFGISIGNFCCYTEVADKPCKLPGEAFNNFLLDGRDLTEIEEKIFHFLKEEKHHAE